MSINIQINIAAINLNMSTGYLLLILKWTN